jgi:Protein of unknown function (DUF3606)
MADDFKKRNAPGDRSCIGMKQEREVRYWTERLGCSEDELAAAIAKVGNSADAVRARLVELGDTDGSDRSRPGTTSKGPAPRCFKASAVAIQMVKPGLDRLAELWRL